MDTPGCRSADVRSVCLGACRDHSNHDGKSDRYSRRPDAFRQIRSDSMRQPSSARLRTTTGQCFTNRLACSWELRARLLSPMHPAPRSVQRKAVWFGRPIKPERHPLSHGRAPECIAVLRRPRSENQQLIGWSNCRQPQEYRLPLPRNAVSRTSHS